VETKNTTMIVTTTNNVEGKTATKYLGIVTGEAIIGANFIKDIFASITDIVGGRSTAYERSLREAKDIALKEMEDNAKQLGANGILGVDLDYETVGKNGGMLMVSASGTAVLLQ
jgi:uncharacterized protein YbjQ (UPF0145 family)